jgi:phage gp29-like protein
MRPNFKEITGIENGRDITRGWVGSIQDWLPSQDEILESKGGGDLRLYQRVSQDDRVMSCMQQRISGTISKEWVVTPGGEKRIDRLAADDLRHQIETLDWDRINEKMLWGVFYGYSIAELILEPDGDRVKLADIRVRNRRRFRFGSDRQPRLITFENHLGEALPERKFWHFCSGADNDDDPYGLGLAHYLYWPTWFKRNDLRWWILYLENFADPATIGTYPDGATDEEKARLEGFVKTVGKSKWAIKSTSTLIEHLEASRSGAADYQAIYELLDKAISTIILSQTMTTSDGSSLSQAQVHQDVAHAVVKSDADLISSSFNNSVARWLTEWNFPGAAIPQCYRKLESEPDLKALADRDKVLSDMGFSPNLKYIIDTYGEGFQQEATETSPVSLNSAQLQSFISLITTAQQAGWQEEMVRTSLEIAFPHLSDDLLDRMAESIRVEEPVASQDPAAVGSTPDPDLEQVASMFAAAPKKKNCKKGVSCGNTCISPEKTCKKPMSDGQKAKKQPIVAAAKANKPNPAPEAAKEPEAVEDPVDPVKTNQANLDAARAAILKQSNEDAVKAAEANAKAILDSPDTGIFVRVGSNSTLAAILGDRFKNSVELGSDADVPGLTEPYQDARKRVEREQMGYADDSDPTKRPIYAYLGNSKNLSSESHDDVSAFGGITVKLKDELKQRATFTGADSFKSGVASRVGDPSAASLIQSSRHGKPVDPEHASSQIDALGKAKNIDDMMLAVQGDGNRYVEAQVHGQVKPNDIAEIHFSRKGDPAVPSKEIRDWAEKNGVNIFKDGEPYEHREISEERKKEIAQKMTPELFADYVNDSVRRIEQSDPNKYHNLTYEDWKDKKTKELSLDPFWNPSSSTNKYDKRNYERKLASVIRKEKYAEELAQSISRGLYVDDAIIDSIPEKGSGSPVSAKVREKMKSDSKKNRDKQQSQSQLFKDMDAILDTPIISDADRSQHKPIMDERSAAAYAKDSVFGDHTFYHGSKTKAAIDSITKDGVKISANTTGMFGGGFYMGAGSDVADVFANDVGDVISFKVKMENPYVCDSTSKLISDLDETGINGDHMYTAFGNRLGDSSAGCVPAYLRLKGHDGVYMSEGSYAIGFEREQMVAFSTRKGKIPRNEYGQPIIDDNTKPDVMVLNKKLLKN